MGKNIKYSKEVQTNVLLELIAKDSVSTQYKDVINHIITKINKKSYKN